MSITTNQLQSFAARLQGEDRSPGTIGKYLRDAAEFTAWLGGRELTRETAAAWREHLLQEGYERLEGILIEDWTELLENRDWVQLQKEWSTAASAPGGEVADNLDLSKTGESSTSQDAEPAQSENA